MKLRYTALALGALIALNFVAAAQAVHAQTAPTIERVRLTDNELGCPALFSEIGQMESLAATPVKAPAAPVAENAVGSQVAGAVATQALAQAAGRTGFGGLFGGLVGAVAKEAAPAPQQQALAQQQNLATQQALAVAAAQGRIAPSTAGNLIGGLSALNAQQSAAPVAAAAPAAVPTLAAQAQARKEHLTALFVAKGCKVSEMPPR